MLHGRTNFVAIADTAQGVLDDNGNIKTNLGTVRLDNYADTGKHNNPSPKGCSRNLRKNETQSNLGILLGLFSLAQSAPIGNFADPNISSQHKLACPQRRRFKVRCIDW